ncbi:hypothetical protein CEXT_162991 [Caerostris extrusa]|uniref:Uncharacterized protein n=1 Tax=Caerostris extrusa TaxID=172846 RepID=A0AAV4WTU0_CAEEX|nr:hypothetical protein CEXT_162991 [Caerostris extrusa]
MCVANYCFPGSENMQPQENFPLATLGQMKTVCRLAEFDDKKICNTLRFQVAEMLKFMHSSVTLRNTDIAICFSRAMRHTGTKNKGELHHTAKIFTKEE